MSKSKKPKIIRRIDNPKEMSADQGGGIGAIGKIITKDKKDKSAKDEAPFLIFDARMLEDEEDDLKDIIKQAYLDAE